MHDDSTDLGQFLSCCTARSYSAPFIPPLSTRKYLPPPAVLEAVSRGFQVQLSASTATFSPFPCPVPVSVITPPPVPPLRPGVAAFLAVEVVDAAPDTRTRLRRLFTLPTTTSVFRTPRRSASVTVQFSEMPAEVSSRIETKGFVC